MIFIERILLRGPGSHGNRERLTEGHFQASAHPTAVKETRSQISNTAGRPSSTGDPCRKLKPLEIGYFSLGQKHPVLEKDGSRTVYAQNSTCSESVLIQQPADAAFGFLSRFVYIENALAWWASGTYITVLGN